MASQRGWSTLVDSGPGAGAPAAAQLHESAVALAPKAPAPEDGSAVALAPEKESPVPPAPEDGSAVASGAGGQSDLVAGAGGQAGLRPWRLSTNQKYCWCRSANRMCHQRLSTNQPRPKHELAMALAPERTRGDGGNSVIAAHRENYRVSSKFYKSH